MTLDPNPRHPDRARRRPIEKPRLLPLLVALILLASPRPARAQWPANGVAICAAVNDHVAVNSVADGHAGAIVLFGTNPPHVYSAQRVLASGAIADGWPVCGITIGAIYGNVSYALAVDTDDASGALVAWMDHRATQDKVFVQHVLGSGTIAPGWLADGNPIAVNADDQRVPALVRDGAGGAFVAWATSEPRVYLQRITGAGTIAPGWPAGGLAMTNPAIHGGTPALAADGQGGVIVAWYDLRNNATSGSDIYAQRVTGAGAIAAGWPVDGVPVCIAPGGQGFDPAGRTVQAVSDGAAGAVVAWGDSRTSATTGRDLYAGRIGGNGAIPAGWPPTGVALCTVAGDQDEMSLVADGAGGAIASFTDGRLGYEGRDVRSQHVSGNGALAPGWSADGFPTCVAPDIQHLTTSTTDDSGGVIVTWTDFRDGCCNGTGDIYAVRVIGSGQLATGWPVNGLAICTAPFRQEYSTPVPDGIHGAVISWTDFRTSSATQIDVFAKRIDVGGPAAVDPWPAFGFRLSPVRPNPARRSATVALELDGATRVTARVYGIAGNRVRTLALDRAYAAGAHALSWDGRDESGAPAPGGIYLVRVTAGGRSLTRTLALLR
jgi:hypothetical protein